jgi:hypothetical protein
LLKRAVSQRLRESLKRSRNGSLALVRVAKTTRLRPTIRFRGEIRRDATRLHPPSQEMQQMPYFVRPRNNGRTFELRVKHYRLPKPVYRNFDLQEDAQRAGRDAVATLDRGEIPSWFERSERRGRSGYRRLPRDSRGSAEYPTPARYPDQRRRQSTCPCGAYVVRQLGVLARWFARDHPCPALCIEHAPVKTRSISL